MQLPVYSLSGEVVRNIEVSDAVFDVPLNEALVHQAAVRQQANARQGTSDTKTRSEVAGGGKKLFRQKHTGLARAGDRRSPIRRGGGITFGPHPRDYRQDMPKKMRRLALRCTLSEKVRDGGLMVLEDLKLDQPKTREMLAILTALGADTRTLIVTSEPEPNVMLSARNLVGVRISLANMLNVIDILTCKRLLMTESSVRRVEELWGGSRASV